jgi:hypothetical protein
MADLSTFGGYAAVTSSLPLPDFPIVKMNLKARHFIHKRANNHDLRRANANFAVLLPQSQSPSKLVAELAVYYIIITTLRELCLPKPSEFLSFVSHFKKTTNSLDLKHRSLFFSKHENLTS